MTATEIIRQHIPDFTEQAEALIDEKLLDPDNEDGSVDYADAAIRECPCGVIVDGFYEYADHLIAELKKAGVA